MGTEEQKNHAFIKIPNQIFGYEKKINDGTAMIYTFQIIGTIGFVILTYFIMKQGNKSITQESIKAIYEYIGSKETEGLRSYKTIKKYIRILQKNEYIFIDNDKENFGINDIILVRCNKEIFDTENNFTIMSEEMFYKKIKMIGHIGWSILCYLSRQHNYSYCGEGDGYGYANPSEEKISTVLNIGLTSVKKYISKLEKCRLIKVVPQSPEFLYNDVNGNPVFKKYNNHYVTYSRIPDHKYYISALDKVIESITKNRNRNTE